MTIGAKVRFTYKNNIGVQQQLTLTLSNDIVSESEMSNEMVYAKFSPLIRQQSMSTLLEKGYIFAARNLLRKDPYASDINLSEVKQQKTTMIMRQEEYLFSQPLHLSLQLFVFLFW